MSLCHVVHFCYTQGWLVLHIPDGEMKHWHQVPCVPCQCYYCVTNIVYFCAAHIWVKNCKELLPSSHNKARFDQPLQASEWLRNFRTTNESFLSTVAIVFASGLCSLFLSNVTQYIYSGKSTALLNLSVFNQHTIIVNFKKCVEILMNIKTFALLYPDKDETSVRVDKERVHQRREHTGRVGGSGESSHTSDECSRCLVFCFFYLSECSVIFKGNIMSLLSNHSHRFLIRFHYSFLAVHLISLQQRPPPGFETNMQRNY